MPRVRGCVQTDQRHEPVSKAQKISHPPRCPPKRTPGRLNRSHPLAQDEDFVAISPVGSRKPGVRQSCGSLSWAHEHYLSLFTNSSNQSGYPSDLTHSRAGRRSDIADHLSHLRAICRTGLTRTETVTATVVCTSGRRSSCYAVRWGAALPRRHRNVVNVVALQLHIYL